ncbi:MAG TPA: PaaX family transcriptional regulator C-terminal domain-containing protein [Pseudonocardia sp.]|nr:PaaX family transcriptional regulator C-terminal domain-containing protein [Pseudonocardia sp.]
MCDERQGCVALGYPGGMPVGRPRFALGMDGPVSAVRSGVTPECADPDPGRGASARSVLFTVLGEYLREPDRQVWTATLLTALREMGIKESAARQSLSRTARAGWLRSTSYGRRMRWRLSPVALEHLAESADEIYRRRRDPPAWDGTWLVLMTSVPESRRELRHRLRTRLRWAGFGPLGQGVWLTPRADAEPLARRVLAELGLTANVLSVLGRIGGLGSEYEVVNRAWDLAGLARDYNSFEAEFPALVAGAGCSVPGRSVFAEHTLMVQRWREFALRDPVLPAELLPARWVGRLAAQRFYQRHDALYRPALRWLEEVDRAWDAGVGHGLVDVSLPIVTDLS